MHTTGSHHELNTAKMVVTEQFTAGALVPCLVLQYEFHSRQHSSVHLTKKC
jgi:hypothetical protein